MSTDPYAAPRPLPDRPNLRHLKDQAKDLLRTGAASSISDAQFKIARLYGFASWPKLKSHVDSFEVIGQLKQAIDTNDLDRVKTMMTRNPALHGAPLGYGKDGPLTWVAECRVPWESPSPVRLAMAEWMLERGSDVHQMRRFSSSSFRTHGGQISPGGPPPVARVAASSPQTLEHRNN